MNPYLCKRFLEGINEDLIISYGDIFATNNLASLLDSTDQISLMIDMNWRDFDNSFTDPLDDAETLIIDSGEHIKELGKNQKIMTKYMGNILD